MQTQLFAVRIKMASNYSDRLKLELMETGANANTWGNNTNTNLETIDAFNAGYLSKNVAGSSNVTLTTNNADPNAEASNRVVEFTGALTGDITVFIPAVENNYIFFNNTSGAHTLSVAPTGHGSNGVAITQGAHTVQYCTGDSVVDLFANSLGDVRIINQLRVGDNVQLNANGVVSATNFVGNGAGISGVDEFPSGTKAMFVQTNAPTGFTKDTTSALNNSTLRVVTGSGGTTGGSVDFTSVFTAKNATGSASLNTAPIPGDPYSQTSGATTVSTPLLASHSHTLIETSNNFTGINNARAPSSPQGVINGERTSTNNPATTFNTNNTGGGGSHTHPVSGNVNYSGTINTNISASVPNMALKYVDNIIASKD